MVALRSASVKPSGPLSHGCVLSSSFKSCGGIAVKIKAANVLTVPYAWEIHSAADFFMSYGGAFCLKFIDDLNQRNRRALRTRRPIPEAFICQPFLAHTHQTGSLLYFISYCQCSCNKKQPTVSCSGVCPNI